MQRLKWLKYQPRVPGWARTAGPVVITLLKKTFPGKWGVKVAWHMRANGQVVVTVEVNLGKLGRK